MNQNHLEILEAAPDAIALAMGIRVVSAHPMAFDLKESPLSGTAYAAGRKSNRFHRDEHKTTTVARGMATQDFSKALADGSRLLVARRFDDQATHRAFCTELEVANFKPQTITGIDVSLDLPALGEFAEVSYGYATLGANSDPVTLRTYAKNIFFSRELIVNDDIGVVRSILSGLGAAAGRVEGGLVYAELERNPILDDGEATFHELHGNVVGEAFSWTALAAAVSCLRKQPTRERAFADLTARHLVVAADLELDARKMVFESGFDLIVTASANLPNGRWYLLADPAQQPTVAILKLKTGNIAKGVNTSIMTEQANKPFAADGTAVRVRADLGAVVLGRVGIVRGGA